VDLKTPVGSIEFVVDDSGAPGANKMGGSIEFYTTADGGTTLTKAVTIGTDQHATFTSSIISAYGTGRAIDITVAEATDAMSAIRITTTPTIDDNEYNVPIWVNANLGATGGGSIYSVRGHVGIAESFTMDSKGYLFGVHGRILVAGTLDSGSIICGGLFGQVLPSTGTISNVSHIACAWLSWQETTTITAGHSEILYLAHNGAGCTIESFIYVYGANAADYFINFANTMTGNWADTGTTEGEECIGHLKVRFNNQDGYINVFSDNS